MPGGEFQRSPPERVWKVPRMDGNHLKSAKAEGSFATDGWSRMKVGVIRWYKVNYRSTDPGDNRLSPQEFTSTRWHLDVGSSHPGAVEPEWKDELGSERRETVRSLSGGDVGYLRGAVIVRRTGWTEDRESRVPARSQAQMCTTSKRELAMMRW